MTRCLKGSIDVWMELGVEVRLGKPGGHHLGKLGGHGRGEPWSQLLGENGGQLLEQAGIATLDCKVAHAVDIDTSRGEEHPLQAVLGSFNEKA